MFSCKLDFSEKNKNDKYKTQIYLLKDSALTSNNEFIYIPISSIAKVEQMVPDPKRTRTLVTVLIVTACVGAAAGLTALFLSRIAPDVKNTCTTCTDIDGLWDTLVEMELCSDGSPD